MVSAKKTSKHELREPDQFTKGFAAILEWAAENYRKLIVAVVAILLITIFVIFTMHLQNKKNQRAAVVFAKAEKMFFLEPDEKEWQKQRLETAKAFAKVNEQYAGSDLAYLALLYQGICLQQAGNDKEAIPLLEKGLAKAKKKSSLYLLGLQRLGVTYLEQGNYDQAIVTLKKISADKNNAFRDIALFYQAEALYKKGKLAEAEELWQEVVDYQPSSVYAEKASFKLQRTKEKNNRG